MSGGTRPGTRLAARLIDPALYTTDPHPLYARLRAEAPVAWNEERGFWAVARHADVSAIENDHDTFCAGRGILVDEIGTTYASPPTMMHSDPPVHTRYRRLVQPAFKPSVARGLEPVIRARTKALVERIDPGTPTDVVARLAVPLPLLVISEILGLPDDEWERCYEWSEAVIPGATDWPEERRNELLGDMIGYLVGTAKERRANPRPDVLTQLAQVEVDGEQLSDDELAMFLVQLLVAGNETTRDLLASGLVAFADHPDQWPRLRNDPALVPTAVEE
ncbi:MAG: cytochrome P450, partial [Acidimicrobiales bacterium]